MEPPVKATLCGDVATIVLDRPKALNAFNLDMISSLADYLINLAADDTIRAIVIGGAGKAFCAGADLRAIDSWAEGYTSAFHNLAARYHQAILEIRRMPKPVIAAVNGIAAGGGFSLALACDFRIAGESAIFRQAYTSNGLTIDGGGTFTLPRLVGLAKALEIAAFDPAISAPDALEMGLITKLTHDDELWNTALAMAEDLKNNSLTSFAHVKELLNASYNTSFETHLENERSALCKAAGTEDGMEGIQAFLEKRKPVFNR
ncbi:enoyl-CoA hydratase/isomerase family protein [Candidatus Micrarchaeota archaeon]|nr:enoyl-CoA hydratase/isomerase family protein [Candidatus Micrarchaeota archaeon]